MVSITVLLTVGAFVLSVRAVLFLSLVHLLGLGLPIARPI